MPSAQNCNTLLIGLMPQLCNDSWTFEKVSETNKPLTLDDTLFALVREDEGVTAIRRSHQQARETQPGPLFARITLQVYSDLEAVGLTAAVSQALTEINVCANVVAGFHHDYIFVPYHLREEALRCLEALSRNAARDSNQPS